MIWITKGLTWLVTSGPGKWAAAAFGAVALVVAFAMEQRSIGGTRAIQNVERATRNAVNLGKAAADKSRSGAGGVRRVVDPTTRND